MINNQAKAKVYFLTLWLAPGKWHAVGMLDDGYIFGQRHVSHPGWANIDLYFSNTAAQTLLKERGLSLDDVKNSHIEIKSLSVNDFVIAIQQIMFLKGPVANEKKRRGGKSRAHKKARRLQKTSSKNPKRNGKASRKVDK